MPKSIFDVVGPVMVGPSSSHTLGACRLARFASQYASGRVVRARFTFYGSFAATYSGHRTDLAVLGGILGMDYDDENLARAREIAAEQGLEHEFIADADSAVTGNVIRFVLETEDGRLHEVAGESVGGGFVVVTEIDSTPVEVTGEYHSLITVHRDEVGMVAAITGVLASFGVNIALLKLFRQEKHEDAIMVAQTDEATGSAALNEIMSLRGVKSAVAVAPIT